MVDLVNEALGSEGNVSLKFEGGKAKLAVSHAHASGSVALVVEEDACYFLDKLAAAIPGAFDDAIIAMAKEVLKKM